jgi:hypothetical protein
MVQLRLDVQVRAVVRIGTNLRQGRERTCDRRLGPFRAILRRGMASVHSSLRVRRTSRAAVLYGTMRAPTPGRMRRRSAMRVEARQTRIQRRASRRNDQRLVRARGVLSVRIGPTRTTPNTCTTTTRRTCESCRHTASRSIAGIGRNAETRSDRRRAICSRIDRSKSARTVSCTRVRSRPKPQSRSSSTSVSLIVVACGRVCAGRPSHQ